MPESSNPLIPTWYDVLWSASGGLMLVLLAISLVSLTSGKVASLGARRYLDAGHDLRATDRAARLVIRWAAFGEVAECRPRRYQ
jgi:hypothetical protein